MTNELMDLRLTNLEDFRVVQVDLNKQIMDALHRIELGLNTTRDKSCPLPGHCVVLESNIKSKWEADKSRFERLEARISENDQWHERMDGKVAALANTVARGLGGLGLLVLLAPMLTWFVLHYLVNK
jgi:hypothetical protein